MNSPEAATSLEDAITKRLERWIRERPELERLMWKDPVLVAGCLTPDYTQEIEQAVLEFFATHSAVRSLNAERKKLLVKTLTEKLDVPLKIVSEALGLTQERGERRNGAAEEVAGDAAN